MSGARMNALATLRGQIERIETAEVVHQHDRVALGHGEVDSALKGGLARAVIHEVFCEGRQGTAATGFVMGLRGVSRGAGRCCGCGRIFRNSRPARCR